MLVISTSKGDIKVELFEDDAPVTVANFLQYVDDGHYDGTIFHRVIENFMVQGGGFTKEFYNGGMMPKETREPIKNEADNGRENTRGTLAMARTNVVDSATSQFFINVTDNAFLNFQAPTPQAYGYCVFGEVVEGMDVVDAIRAVDTGNVGHHGDVPDEPVMINSIKRA